MVKMILTFLTILFLTSTAVAGPNTALLHTTSTCPYCSEATIIINKLIAEGYDVKISHNNRKLRLEQNVTSVPTLVTFKNGRVANRYQGLQTEERYRELLTKKNEIFLYVRMSHPERQQLLSVVNQYKNDNTNVTIVSVPGPTFVVVNGNTYFGIRTAKQLKDILANELKG
jgi:glutaredoxin